MIKRKRLVLKKETITNLSKAALKMVYAGGDISVPLSEGEYSGCQPVHTCYDCHGGSSEWPTGPRTRG